MASIKKILVTGANQGIGLALVKQLCNHKDHKCHVYLGCRNVERGQKAVQQVQELITAGGSTGSSVELVVIDVGNDDSVVSAAKSLQEKGVTLNAIVNNAGTGIAHEGITSDMILNVNIFGPKRVVDAFLPLLEPSGSSRIVNVGSGGGSMYVQKQELDRQKLLCSTDITWEEITQLTKDGIMSEGLFPGDNDGSYGLSKALLASYTMLLAKTYPTIQSYCISPGYVNTSMTSSFPGGKKPDDATLPILHCLFGDLPAESSGWYFGSDAKRSPLHVMRNPGEPEYDGSLPW